MAWVNAELLIKVISDVKDSMYENMFKSLEDFEKKSKKWSPERRARSEEVVRVFDSLLSIDTKRILNGI